MIKLSLIHRDYRAGQLADGAIAEGRGVAERERKMGIELVLFGWRGDRAAPGSEPLSPPVPTTLLHEHTRGPFAQEPYAGIDKRQIIDCDRSDFLSRGFLQKERRLTGTFPVRKEDAEIFGHFRSDPHSKAQ